MMKRNLILQLASLSQPIQSVYHLNFNDQVDLTSTFLRFQESYESPKFLGKVFSLADYKEWYTERYRGFTYYTDWRGFNIPSFVLGPFLKGLYDPLTLKEKALCDLFKKKFHKKKFYIIGTYGEEVDLHKDLSTLKHEIGHGLYYTNSEYKKEVLEITNQIDKKPIVDMLTKLGYHKFAHEDEIHAYLLAGSDDLEKYEVDVKPYHEAIEKINKVYSKHVS